MRPGLPIHMHFFSSISRARTGVLGSDAMHICSCMNVCKAEAVRLFRFCLSRMRVYVSGRYEEQGVHISYLRRYSSSWLVGSGGYILETQLVSSCMFDETSRVCRSCQSLWRVLVDRLRLSHVNIV
jgi:hypothetical protein